MKFTAPHAPNSKQLDIMTRNLEAVIMLASFRRMDAETHTIKNSLREVKGFVSSSRSLAGWRRLRFPRKDTLTCHCVERNYECSAYAPSVGEVLCFATLLLGIRWIFQPSSDSVLPPTCHCEERIDQAISAVWPMTLPRTAALAMTVLSFPRFEALAFSTRRIVGKLCVDSGPSGSAFSGGTFQSASVGFTVGQSGRMTVSNSIAHYA